MKFHGHWTDMLEHILKNAKEFKLDPKLVYAIIKAESNFNTYALRYEPHFRFRLNVDKYAQLNGLSRSTEDFLQSCSIGAMQIMGCVARELQYRDNLLKLTKPDIGIHLGCKKLRAITDNLGARATPEGVISDYNDGYPGKIKNPDYVNRVKKFMEIDFEKLI